MDNVIYLIYTQIYVFMCVCQRERERDRGKCIDTDRQKGLTTVLRRNKRKMFLHGTTAEPACPGAGALQQEKPPQEKPGQCN